MGTFIESISILGILLLVIIGVFVILGVLARSLGVGVILTSFEDKYDREHNIAKYETPNEYITRKRLEGDDGLDGKGTLYIVGMPDKDNKEPPYIRL
jgi:hypothetical protein